LAGVTSAGVLMAIFQSNAGGAWDNAKKMIESDGRKGSDAHKAAVVGDTVGDPFKDTSGPSLNILLKLMSVVALVIAPSIAMTADTGVAATTEEVTKTITMNVENEDMAEATINYTTVVNGTEVSEEKIFKGTKAEVEAQLKEFGAIVNNSKGTETEITIEKMDIRKE